MPHYEYDKDYPFAAFITNLGKYNEGDLVGEWVKFPTTPEEMQKVFERIGIGQKDDFGQPYEEWFITDYDCYVDGLYDKLGEYESLDELNYLASKLDEMSQGEYEQFQAAMEIGDHSGSLQEIELTGISFSDAQPESIAASVAAMSIAAYFLVLVRFSVMHDRPFPRSRSRLAAFFGFSLRSDARCGHPPPEDHINYNAEAPSVSSGAARVSPRRCDFLS